MILMLYNFKVNITDLKLLRNIVRDLRETQERKEQGKQE